MEKNSSVISRIESYIADNFQNVQKYFPRLGHYLMFLTSEDIPEKACQKAIYLNSKLFLYILSYISSKKDFEYRKAHKEFSSLVTEEILPDSYLKFNDGLVYSKSFNTTKLSMQIEDTALDFKIMTEDIIKASNVNILNNETFRTVVINVLISQLNEYEKDMEDIYSNEYLEMAFMQSLKRVLETSILIDSTFSNQN